MRSALVNENTFVVENICVAAPVTPSPYSGLFMVGLQEAVYETQSTANTETHPSGSTISINTDSTISITLPDGTKQEFPAGTTAVTNSDGTITTSYTTTEEIMISAGTACDMGWIYDPATGLFSAP